jgi:hypothetical protein
MKKLDTVLISARNQDLASIIGNARYLENLALDGKKPDDIINEAKRALNIADDELVMTEAIEKVKLINRKSTLLANLFHVFSEAEKLGYSTDNLNSLTQTLTNEIASVYNVEPDMLFLSEEE